MTGQERTQRIDSAEEERRGVRDELTARLRDRGVGLTGRETDDELVDVLDAVEGFESAVESGGGDLMVDEPVAGRAPIQPDDVAFVLPRRDADEPIASFIDRIAVASARARGKHADDSPLR